MTYVTYEGNPVHPIFMKNFQAQNWGTSPTGTPTSIISFGNTLYLTPVPSAVGSVVIWGLKNSSGFADDTTETGVEIASTIAFKVLQDLWASVDQKKSNYFGARHTEKLKLMVRNDKDQISSFGTLTESENVNFTSNQVDYPNVITT
jgi:hypothetical protein